MMIDVLSDNLLADILPTDNYRLIYLSGLEVTFSAISVLTKCLFAHKMWSLNFVLAHRKNLDQPTFLIRKRLRLND